MESANMTLTKNPNYYNISQNYTSLPMQSNRQHQLKNNSMKSNKIQPIAPAPPTTNLIHNINITTGTNKNHHQHHQPINSVCVDDYKKKYTYANLPYSSNSGGEQQLPQSVARRNARERNRVKQVNNGFATLRQHIPQSVVASLTNGGRGASKKLSKVDTLRIAVEYISRLQELINNNESDSDNSGTSSYHSALSTIGSSNYDYYTENQTDMKQEENFTIRSPSYSEISSSPSPSCSSSDQSSIQSNQYYQMQPMVMSSSTPIVLQQQFKYDTSYDHTNYNNSSITETTPEDEELLDYISSWQEQQ